MSTTSLLELGNTAFSQGNYRRALDYYQKGLEAARGDPDLLADLYGNIGNVYGASGQVEQAVIY
jgi:tetratricopeptide (TPR) repeat protein